MGHQVSSAPQQPTLRVHFIISWKVKAKIPTAAGL